MSNNELTEAKKLLSFKKSTNEEEYNSSPFLVYHTVYDSINSVTNPGYSQHTASDKRNASFLEHDSNSNCIGSTTNSISALGNSVKKGNFIIQLVLYTLLRCRFNFKR